MIKAEFAISENGDPIGFKISGHSGFADAPCDIVCASVSSMTNLIINIITEKFKSKTKIKVDDKAPSVELQITDFGQDKCSVSKIIDGFFDQLVILENDYPKYVSVKKFQK